MSRILRINQIDLSLGVGIFGKHEVEEAADKLVRFFKFKGLWCSFTFIDLHRFYVSQKWDPNMALFGLFGDWYDDGGVGNVLTPPSYIVNCGKGLETTKLFREKVSKPTLDVCHTKRVKTS